MENKNIKLWSCVGSDTIMLQMEFFYKMNSYESSPSALLHCWFSVFYFQILSIPSDNVLISENMLYHMKIFAAPFSIFLLQFFTNLSLSVNLKVFYLAKISQISQLIELLRWRFLIFQPLFEVFRDQDFISRGLLPNNCFPTIASQLPTVVDAKAFCDFVLF